jgi:hypothetical protein
MERVELPMLPHHTHGKLQVSQREDTFTWAVEAGDRADAQAPPRLDG